MTDDTTISKTTTIPKPTATPGRRGLLKLFGAAAAGGVIAMATTERAAAADGDPLVIGSVTNAANGGTGLQVNGGPVAYGLAVTDNGLGSLPPAIASSAVIGHAKSNAFRFGVTGYTEGLASLSAGVYGFAQASGIGVLAGASGTAGIASAGKADGPGGIGVAAIGAGDNAHGVFAFATGVGVVTSGLQGGVTIRQYTTPLAPPPERTGTEFSPNCLDVDADHNLWWSVSPGPNAQWRKVSGPGTGGAFHPLSPTRVFDSRSAAPHKGLVASGHPLTISIKDGRSATTGAINRANLVPARATAIACNVTVTNTVGAGHLAINPGGTTSAAAITVSWYASGQTHTTGTIVKINPATLQMTLAAAGLGKTHVIVDITGYWR